MTQAAVLASNASLMTTPSGTAPNYMCRAWVNFVGTGTVTINASGNVTSITDNSTGNYTANFTTALTDVNYSAVFGGKYSTGQPNQGYGIVSQLAASCRFTTGTPSNNTVQDFDIVCVAIFR